MDREKVAPLLRLQETDQEIERIFRRLGRIEEERQNLIKRLSDLEGELKSLEEEVNILQREIRVKKDAIKEEERLLDRAEQKLRLVRKDIEYKALLREKSKHEDNILKMSYELDDLEKALHEATKKLNSRKPSIERQIKNINEELEDLDYEEKLGKNRLEELKKLREERSKEVDQSLLKFYEEAKVKFEAGVIVKVEDEVCGGCGMKIPDILFGRMLKENSIEICPSCGRYIYYKL